MSLIQVEHLSFCYPGSYDAVFSDVSFRLDTDWKLGLIGRNGRGKTTLLRLLRGEFEYEGRITASAHYDYFPYPVSDPHRRTWEVLEEICPQAEEWELLRELSALGLKDDLLYRNEVCEAKTLNSNAPKCCGDEVNIHYRYFDTLSNGEQTKLLLAALFLVPGNFLLIDEPTNHLDAAGRAQVAAYLKRKKGFILVSHDRDFLDGCIDHVMSINRRSIEVRAGNYSAWQAEHETRERSERERSLKLKKDIGRLEASARQAAVWSARGEDGKFGTTNSGLSVDRGFVGAQSARMMKRSRTIQRRREQAVEEKSALLRDVELEEDLKLSPLTHHARTLVTLSDVAVQYGERTVCAGIKLAIHPGDRIALAGPNGCGKSSLLKLILGEDIPHKGSITCASGLVTSYVSQDTAHLSGNLSDYARARNIDESLFKAILRKMGFERVQFEKDMAGFSGGQKKKVLIAASLCECAHLYIWDEPLNFIDLHSRLRIEALLLEYRPTMLFVEHDRAFQRSVATRVISL